MVDCYNNIIGITHLSLNTHNNDIHCKLSSMAILPYEIINEFPHDQESYTQGLEFYNDTLYESTGLKGKSTIRKLNYRTGEVYLIKAMDDVYFGEGLTFINNKLIQLTWREGIGFQYNPITLEV